MTRNLLQRIDHMLLLVLLVGGTSVVSAGDDSGGFGSPKRTYVMPPACTEHLAKWGDGFMVSATSDPRPVITVCEPAKGSLVYQVDLWQPEAARMLIQDTAVNGEGTAAAAVQLWKSDGTLAVGVFIVEKPGRITRVIRTNPLVALRVGFGPDQSIWALVRDAAAEETGRDYDVLQKYGREGQFLGSFLRRSLFPGKRHPAAHANGGITQMVKSPDRIGIFLATTGEWVEVNPEGALLGRSVVKAPWPEPTKGDPPRKEREPLVSRVLLTAAGEAYADVQEGRCLKLLRLDRQAGQWVVLPDRTRDFAQSPIITRLIGSEGEEFVFHGPNLSTIQWVDIRR